ncbi:hypothetical protein MKJ04_20905 [Pontibacter sp. E15-1]|uniref:hypothetical protein n=1 Tax=Pontibacter sp. E15-1 TaxID=2919918 RepID=UPI001F5000F4|nr:hypothetical protein [Pontibacter sp. E15-1]MCJ8167313.1 hypothetical protein [Pontibacter sp. E15-1]
MHKISYILLGCLLLTYPLLAQEPTGTINLPPAPEHSGEVSLGIRSINEMQLSYAVLFFGLLVLGLEFIIIRQNNIPAQDTIKFIVITMVIVSTLFLITSGYSDSQIAPAIGLLGTITGYLLGKIDTPNKV